MAAPKAAPVDVLLVEGKDDQHVCWALFEHHRVPETFTVVDKEGVDTLLAGLEAEIDVPGRTRLGIWLMPDNRLSGMLEDFMATLVRPDDALLAPARNAVDAIPADHRLFKPAFRAKAELHTWLAWQEEPGRPLGQAITKRYLDFANPGAEAFVAWVRRLFA